MARPLVFIGDLAPYLAACNTTHKKQFDRLLTQANRYFLVELPTTHPNGSTTYMGIAIVNLALAYRLTQDDKYLQEAKRWMNTVLSYEKWGFAHLVNVDLSASWILFGLSLGFDWLQDFLTEAEATAVKAKIAHHAKVMYDHKIATAGSDWSTAYYQNHNWINLNSLATAGYTLGEDAYIEMAKENFARVYDYMPEDGSNYEGTVYWRYGGMWLFVYAHLLKTQEGLDYFKKSAYLQNTFYYRLYQSAPGFAQQLNFGDCHDRHSGHAACVYYKVAAEYGDGYAQTYANLVLDNFLEIEAENSKVKPGILPEAAFEFLWYAPEVAMQSLSVLPTVRYFDDLGLLCMRNNWEQDAKVFTMKCSPPGGKKQWKTGWGLHYDEGIDCIDLMHHHPDNLSYIYAHGEDYLTCEDGYNRNLMPDNHNVLLVDGQYTDIMNVNDTYMASAKARLAQNPEQDIVNTYRGEVTAFETLGDMVYYAAETAKIYPEALQMRSVSRTFFTDGLEFIVFVDRFASEAEHTYSVLSNTCEVAVSLSTHSYRYHLEDEALTYTVQGNVPLVPKQYEQSVTAVMTTQEPDKVCRTEIKTLCFETQSPCKEAVMVECLVPSDMTVSYQDYKICIAGKKNYTIILKEGFAQYGIVSEKNMHVTVTKGQTITVHEW